MGSLGPFEIIAILLVILLLFGAKRIPEIARGLGKGIREFKDATNDIKKELTVEAPPQQPRQVQPPTVHQTPQQTTYAPPADPASSTPPAPAPPPPADGQTPQS
ncbi:MAG: twin-arginine translocase TatA/TatE family subunit [Bacteroidota bacterium]